MLSLPNTLVGGWLSVVVL